MEEYTFERQASFRSLCSHYRENPIILYAGAGISKSNDSAYGLPDWIGLLKRLGEEITGTRNIKLSSDPWAAADRILKQCVNYLKSTGKAGDNPKEEAEGKMQEALWEIIRNSDNLSAPGKKHPYKLLNRTYLENALTLRAVAAFCARPISKSNNSEVYRFGANPRVRAVLSGNYDPYLEAAATSMFKIPVVKPVAAFGSLAGSLRKVPVYHVHGYVPHEGQKKREHKPLQKELVLTRSSYKRAWREKDAFCATMISQIFLLRHYVTLFIGFSFTDPKITKLLGRILQEYPEKKKKARRNYAIIRKGDDPKKQARDLEKLGVRPVFITDYDEIPNLLGKVYETGLQDDHPDDRFKLPFSTDRKIQSTIKGKVIKCSNVWEMLYTCHQSHPGVLSAP